MTKFKVSSDVEFKDPPIKASKGSIVSIREITSEVQSAVDAGVLLTLGSIQSKPVISKVVTDSVDVGGHDFQKHVLTSLAAISRQIQELSERFDAASSKKRK